MANRVKQGRMRLSRRAVCGLLAAAPVLMRPAWAGEGGGISPWVASEHARMRLIDAGPSPRDGHNRLVGIEIELDPQYLTYWRSPGEAGMAPIATFSGSTNLRGATLLYPAPGRFSEGGTEAIGYKNRVLFPLEVVAKEAGKPVTLALDFAFATCERLCVPARAQAKLVLDEADDAEAAARVREALARVPAPAAVGEPGPLGIAAVTGEPGQTSVTVLAKSSGSEVPLLFAEAPEPWFVQAGAGLWTNDGSLKYKVSVLSKPSDPAPLPLRLTLVGTDEAIDVSFQLDAPAPPP